MLNIADADIVSLRQKSIELALKVPSNLPEHTATTNTEKVLIDAQIIFNWITKDKESTPTTS